MIAQADPEASILHKGIEQIAQHTNGHRRSNFTIDERTVMPEGTTFHELFK
jgi:hypothetical protein